MIKFSLRFLSTLILICASTELLSQELEKNRTIKLYEMWEEIFACDTGTYQLNNAKIIYQFDERKKLDSLFKENPIVSCALDIRNNTYVAEESTTIPSNINSIFSANNLCFQKDVLIRWNKINTISFKNCQFEAQFEIINISETPLYVEFGKCTFQKRFNFSNSSSKTELYIGNCDFVLPEYSGYSSTYADPGIDLSPFGGHEIKFHVDLDSEINIADCNFSSHSPKNSIHFMGDAKSVSFVNNHFQESTIIQGFPSIESLEIYHNNFEDLSFNDFMFHDSQRIRMDWNQFKKGLCLINIEYKTINLEYGLMAPIKKTYYGSSTDDMKNDDVYFDLVATHSRLYQVYKDNGALESANACLIEMKNIQTTKYESRYANDKTLENWVYWKLNLFLKFFSQYGTSPSRCIVICIWTILAFSVLYFFFYSDWDKINRSFLMQQHTKMLTYLTSEQKMEDFYSQKHTQEYESYESYKSALTDAKVKVPYFINLLGKPLYHLSLVKHNIKRFVYRRTEILKGKWAEEKQPRKRLVAYLVGTFVFIYLFYLILLRALNSLMLSINTFSTLGFGDIPVKGLTRYLAILEGFTGWFLLSIFSVTLIGQMIQ